MKKYIMFVALMMSVACMVLLSGFTLPTLWGLVLFICAIGADFLTTYLCIRSRGTEGNPVIAFLFKRISVGGTFLMMACLWSVFIWLRWLPSNLNVQTATACTYWLVPMNNLVVLKRLMKGGKAHA